MYDTGSEAKGSILAYRKARSDKDNGDGTNSLHSIVGCARSDASKPMATLGGIDGVVQNSYWSTSDGLQDTGVYPFFARSIPADSAVAKAAAEFFKAHGYTHIGIAYIMDPYGEAYKDAFVKFCQDEGINVITAGFLSTQESVEAAVGVLAASNVRVGLFVSFDTDFGHFAAKGKELGVSNFPGSLWIVADGVGDSAVKNLGGDANGMGKVSAEETEGKKRKKKFRTLTPLTSPSSIPPPLSATCCWWTPRQLQL